MRWEFIMSLFAMHALLKNAAGMPLNRIMWIGGKMSQAKNDHYKFEINTKTLPINTVWGRVLQEKCLEQGKTVGESM